jgi:hypothetical protein
MHVAPSFTASDLPLHTVEDESVSFGRGLLLSVPEALCRITLTPR